MFGTLLLAATIRVSAAASLMDALGEIARKYQKDAIVLNFGASSLLARQIIEGAPADVFISADEIQMDRLQQRGLIASRKNILSNTLVVVVPADSRIAAVRFQVHSDHHQRGRNLPRHRDGYFLHSIRRCS